MTSQPVAVQVEVAESCTADAVTDPVTDCAFTPGEASTCGAGCTYAAPVAANANPCPTGAEDTCKTATAANDLSAFVKCSCTNCGGAPGHGRASPSEFRRPSLHYDSSFVFLRTKTLMRDA